MKMSYMSVYSYKMMAHILHKKIKEVLAYPENMLQLHCKHSHK